MALKLEWTRSAHFPVWCANAGELRAEVAEDAGGWAATIVGIKLEDGFTSRDQAQEWTERALATLAHDVLKALGQ